MDPIDPMDVYSRCRLCAGVYDLGINIFGDEGRKMDVQQKINTYLAFDVQLEDSLPKNICYLCLGRIEEFHNFKTMCSVSQSTLKNWTDCLDDEDMLFCAQYNCTAGFEVRERNKICTSFFSTDSNATTVSVDSPDRKHLEESSNGHKFSNKKIQKTNNGTPNKLKSDRHSRRTEQSPSETSVTQGPSETFVSVNGVCSTAFSSCNSAPSRRKMGSHTKNTTQQIEEFTTSDDDDDEEVEMGFPGFVAERHTSAPYNLDMDSGPSSENETVGENTKEREQNEFNDSDSLLDNIGRAQLSQISNEAELLSVVKQEPDEEAYTQFKCNVCHRIFTRKSTLKEHLKRHTGNDPYRCPSCRKPFGNNYRLKLHMSTHKNDGYKCRECNMEFSQEKAFLKHIQIHRVKHCAPKTSTPNIQFIQKTTVMQNERHKKQKKYYCKYCNASFQDKHSCGDHMRCHFAEKPYGCNLCDRRFTQQGNLMAHLKVHRNESFICRLCKSSFSSKAELTEHLSLTHRDVILEVVNDANDA